MKNAYVEITNICNLSCEFCPGHSRPRRHMSASEFETVARKLDGKVENLFLHLMGEPLLHPDLEKIINAADKMNVKLKITTNGTLLPLCTDILKASEKLHTVSISVHSFVGNVSGSMMEMKLEKYLRDTLECAKQLAKSGKFVVLRLWDLESDGSSGVKEFNDKVISLAKKFFPPEKNEWVQTHRGERIFDRIFIEWGERFTWPESGENGEIITHEDEMSGKNCYGLRAQFGILSNGTVVPCCLDRNGDIPLGNIFESEIEDILSSPRARAMREAMEKHRFIEPLCASCDFKRK